MRRDRADRQSVSYLWLILGLIVYQIATSLYTLFPPLMGVFFCYVILLREEEEKTREEQPVERYLAFGYLIFAELNKGFYLFSSVIFFLFFYHVLVDWIKTVFTCQPCILSVFVASGYAGIYGVNNLVSYILNEDFFVFGWEYGLFIFIETIIAVVLFRDRLI